MSTTNDWAPDACTLPTAEQPLRVAEFDALFAEQLETVNRVDATTAELMLGGDAQTAADLIRRESECCSFFRFELTQPDHGRFRLRIGVPPAYVAVLDALTVRALKASDRG